MIRVQFLPVAADVSNFPVADSKSEDFKALSKLSDGKFSSVMLRGECHHFQEPFFYAERPTPFIGAKEELDRDRPTFAPSQVVGEP